jgi:hypothetical protein
MAKAERVGDAFEFVPANSNNLALAEDYGLTLETDDLYIADGTDVTKRVLFDLSGLATGTDRTINLAVEPMIVTDAATRTLTAAESGSTVVATLASGTQTFTLPAAAAGLKFRFIAHTAAGEILITPATGDTINIMTFAAIGADADTARVGPAAGTGIKNTAASNVVGDCVELLAVDGTMWYSTGITVGIWASQ